MKLNSRWLNKYNRKYNNLSKRGAKYTFGKKWLVMSDNIQRYQAGLTDILNVKKKE